MSNPKENSLRNITIIVPIFNAYDDTKDCLDSVLLYTDYRHKILLMDDASNDQRVAELTNKLSCQYSHITYFRHTENVGFVRNCNVAFNISEQTEDVVLLNSDTIVTPNWLEKLILAAYSSSNISTVTPLTNNGTICSVPNWLEENKIPEGYDIVSFSKLIETISLTKYPRVPTAVGFCMYIKRKVLDEVGYFDEVNFGKGYGEENDFCCRASHAGYYHIVDDSTFVYHAGSKSFGEQKQKLIQKNLATLSTLHPNYLSDVNRFIENQSMQSILDNIRLNLYIYRIKKLSPICFILHNSTEYPVNNPLGGTEYQCSALITNLKKIRPIYTLYFNKYKSSISFNIFFEEEKVSFEFPCQLSIDPYLSQNTDFLNLFTFIDTYFQPSIVHIHHLINLPIIDVSQVLRQEKIPYLISIHDYYFLCPSYNLIDYQGSFCYEFKNEKYCQECSHHLFLQGKDLKKKWSDICGELLHNSKSIICPSEVSASYVSREYTSVSDKIKVIRHGIFPKEIIEKKLQSQVDLPIENSSDWSILPLKVAFVGGITAIKGLKAIDDLIQKVSGIETLKNSFEFYFFGSCTEHVFTNSKNVDFNPPYQSQDLPLLLKGIDVCVFLPITAETYCLTADEVVFCGVPIITSPIGAIAERVQKFGIGWVSPSWSSEDLINIFLYIKGNFKEFREVKKNVDNYPVISYEEMTSSYLEEYQKIERNSININLNVVKSSDSFFSPKDIFTAYIQALDKNYFAPKKSLSKNKYLSFLKQNFYPLWLVLKRIAVKFRILN